MLWDFIALGVGTFIGNVCFTLLPETAEELGFGVDVSACMCISRGLAGQLSFLSSWLLAGVFDIAGRHSRWHLPGILLAWSPRAPSLAQPQGR